MLPLRGNIHLITDIGSLFYACVQQSKLLCSGSEKAKHPELFTFCPKSYFPNALVWLSAKIKLRPSPELPREYLETSQCGGKLIPYSITERVDPVVEVPHSHF